MAVWIRRCLIALAGILVLWMPQPCAGEGNREGVPVQWPPIAQPSAGEERPGFENETTLSYDRKYDEDGDTVETYGFGLTSYYATVPLDAAVPNELAAHYARAGLFQMTLSVADRYDSYYGEHASRMGLGMLWRTYASGPNGMETQLDVRHYDDGLVKCTFNITSIFNGLPHSLSRVTMGMWAFELDGEAVVAMGLEGGKTVYDETGQGALGCSWFLMGFADIFAWKIGFQPEMTMYLSRAAAFEAKYFIGVDTDWDFLGGYQIFALRFSGRRGFLTVEYRDSFDIESDDRVRQIGVKAGLRL